MKARGLLFSILGFIIFILLLSSFYTVTEGERALLLRLGELVKNPKTGEVKVIQPGIHFKMPFVTNVRYFDVRLRTLNVDSSRILTKEQKYVLVDYYAKWRIDNLALYFKRTRGFSAQTEQLLQQKTNDALRAAFGQHNIKDVVSGERLNIMTALQQKTNKSAEELGVKVVDVRIVGIDLPSQVRDSVFQRMRTQREQVATRFRAEGQAKSESIKATVDRQVAVMIAKAKTQAQKIRAKGDGEAAGIYTAAYSKNPGF